MAVWDYLNIFHNTSGLTASLGLLLLGLIYWQVQVFINDVTAFSNYMRSTHFKKMITAQIRSPAVAIFASHTIKVRIF